jgi:hypothetical protein
MLRTAQLYALCACLIAGIAIPCAWLLTDREAAIDQDVIATQSVSDKAAANEPLSFNRDIRPILSDKCFACHGPDAAIAKDAGGFRLDIREGAVAPAEASGMVPIVPGKAEESELIKRITTDKPNLVMPPPKAKITLTGEEIALLKRWINEGAEYQGHWAYQTPSESAPPEVNEANERWVRNDIDRFIAARLERAGLSPSELADKTTLIRRVSLDLTGLPPTPEEIDAFVSDASPDAYEKLVDRLLASPHFGERLALIWLDASRYADTIGYQLDHYRSAWPYRDYIIKSFNENKPYDQFLVEQLAGDLLPNATDEQILATAFCRMHMMNHEGGSIDEEFRVTAVADRIETIATVFMAQTYNCAMCHDHKYDPTTQQDYYNLFKYFHSINERGVWTNKPERAIAYGDRIQWYTDEQRAELAQAEAVLNHAIKARQDATPEADKQQAQWEEALREKHRVRWVEAELIGTKTTDVSGAFTRKPDGSVLLSTRDIPRQENLTLTYQTEQTGLRLIKLDALTDPWNADRVGRADNGQAQPTHIKITVTSVKDPSKKQQVKLAGAWATQSNQVKDKELGPLNLLKPGKPGWSTGGNKDKHPRTLLLVADEPFGFVGGSHLEVFIEHRSGLPRQTLGRIRIGFAAANASVVELLSAREYETKEAGFELAPLGLIEPAGRTAHGTKTLAEQWGRNQSPKFAKLSSAVEQAEKQLQNIQKQATPVSVMKELAKPKPMYVLSRGGYDKPIKNRPAELVLPSFIELPMPEGAPNNRLGFAQWLVQPEHPLTARVHVNRLWQMVFGTGIVATVEDFGSQADWPSHPALLDTLAVQFAESGWDQKALIKRIVMSATYRQQAKRNLQANEMDPNNRLLSYFPRQRLPGEIIRDHALATSGLLNETIGGPSVKPYQPEGLWREVSMGPRSNTHIFKRDDGDKLYRRSIYTFIKRKSPPPQLATFGTSNREACVVQRDPTNTPLQALVLWNDEQFLEAARVLAQNTLAQAQGDDQRMALMVRRCTGHMPAPKQLAVLSDALSYYRDRFQQSPEDAKALLAQGEHPLPANYDASELAAWMMIGSTVLSLDETIVRD